jgi:type VI secretion system secreted protein VgrG
MHAEKDHEVTIKNSQTVTIGEDFMPPKGSPSRSVTLEKGDDQLTIQFGDQSISIPMGQQSTSAMIMISHTVGMTSVTLTPASISTESPVINRSAETVINDTAGATINLTAPIINLTGVVNISGALLVDGMVPMLVP